MPNLKLKGQWNAVAIAAAVLLALSILLGGASRENALRLALVELGALPALVFGLNWLLRKHRSRDHAFAIGLVAAIVALPLIQLIPLPPAIWERLPGRDELLLALQITNIRPGWAPMSFTPDETWRSALALIPPVAMFIAVLSLAHGDRKHLVYLCILGAVAGILLGTAQLASGGERLYPWATTGAGAVTGFFANRNHLASYLLVTLPFVVALGAGALRRRRKGSVALWLSALFAGMVVVALAAIRSRAGLALFGPTIAVSLLAAWIATGRQRPGPGLLVMAGTVGAAMAAVAVLALPPILARFDKEGAPEVRFERWPLVAETAQSYLPLGTGIGSFDPVYRSVEPLEELDSTFFNQAHNEYLQTWLEAGWLGIGLIAAFLVWYGRRTWTAWRAPASTEGDLQRAASIGIGVLVLHSAGDYPLRTTTLAVLLALCCGLLELAARSNEGARTHAPGQRLPRRVQKRAV